MGQAIWQLNPVMLAGLAAVSVLALFVARPALNRLIDAVFDEGARLADQFAEAVRAIARSARTDARVTLAQMQREEFANEVAARQKELALVLDRFATLERRNAALVAAIDRGDDPRASGASDKALMTLAAELAAADDRFAKNIDYVKANAHVLDAVHDEKAFSFSPFTRFFFAAAFIPFIAMAGVLNFFLIERPLESLFDETGYVVAGVATLSEVSAATIIVIEAVLGFFFLESLRITRVLPNFHELAPRVRAVWASVFFVFLLGFSAIEAALAFWRKALIDREMLVEFANAPDLGAAPLIVQVALGMLMPFVLALIAIPLEVFLRNARIVGLFCAAGLFHLLALPFFVFGAGARLIGRVLHAALDLVVFAPDAVARLVNRRGAS